jgi:NAD(P)-dependent dehydrogenase (short-subunit alcohol dehydrogenase family)
MSSILDSFSLAGKVAIVTGASSGLGVAFAVGLADAGADIAICARRIDKLEQTKAQVLERGRRCIAVQADVSDPNDCDRVVAETVEQLGKVDVLINNAGIGTAVPATREAPDEFRSRGRSPRYASGRHGQLAGIRRRDARVRGAR